MSNIFNVYPLSSVLLFLFGFFLQAFLLIMWQHAGESTRKLRLREFRQYCLVYGTIVLSLAAFFYYTLEWNAFLEMSAVSLVFFLPYFLLIFVLYFREEILSILTEKALLFYTLIFWCVLFGSGLSVKPEIALFFGAISLIPTSGVLLLSFTRHRIGGFLKSSFYLWFIIVYLAVLVFQLTSMPSIVGVAQLSTPLGAVEDAVGSFSSGMAVFLLVIYLTYMLCLIYPPSFSRVAGWKSKVVDERLFLEDSKRIMAGHFSDEQIKTSESILLLAAVVGSFVLNQYLSVIAPSFLVSLWIIVSPFFISKKVDSEIVL